MTQAEFEAWAEFYRLHPFDDGSRYQRPAALIAYAASNAPNPAVGYLGVADALDWLVPKQRAPSRYSAADLATFKAFGVTPPTLIRSASN